MSIDDRFLKLSALGAANTAHAYRPIRLGPLCIPGFATSWLTSEMPLHAIGLQALGTAGYVAKGAARSPKGIAALGLTAASWAGLWNLHKSAQASEQVFENALRQELGANYREGIDPSAEMYAEGPIKVNQVRVPFMIGARKRWGSDLNVSYGEAGKRNLLDVWRRDDLPHDGHAPVLLQVHGGAWTIGNKEEQALPLMALLAEHGWVCVSINYRLSPRATWPDHIVDVKRAIAWVKENIASYGGDPNFIAITGGSAGGHLSALAATSANFEPFQPGFESVDTSVQAAVPFYGVYDFWDEHKTGRPDMAMALENIMGAKKKTSEQLYREASPTHHISKDAPPFFVLHGTNDVLTYVTQARQFVDELRKVSPQPVVFAELPNTQHAFDIFNSTRAQYGARAAHRFLLHAHTQWKTSVAA